MTRHTDLSAYFREAASWDGDRVAQAERATRNARLLASGLAVLAVAALGAVATLTPLKTVEPYLIRVDNTTGVVDVVPAYTGGVPVNEAVTRYLLTHYVMTCERFALAVVEQDYAECGSFHTPQRNQTWAAQWAAGNPDSPLNRYKDGTTVHTDVQAVSFFARATGATDLAQLRFTRETRPSGGGAGQTTHWIATVQYAYGKPSTDLKSRRWNPLGFRVLDYQLEPEVTTPTTAPATAATTVVQSIAQAGARP
jgi:type IV secretion system protein VirB8